MKLFYDHLIIEIDQVYAEIELLTVNEKRKQNLKTIIDETIHHAVLDTILSHLEKRHHQKFLVSFYDSPNDPLHLSFLKSKVEEIEDRIQQTAKELRKNMLAELLPKAAK